MVKCFRKSVSLSDVWVSSHDKLSDFYASSWQRGDSAVPMLVIRLMLAAIAGGIFVWSLWEMASPYWLMYLTNWGLLMVFIMTISSVIVSGMAAAGKLKDEGDLPWYVSMYWLLFNVTVTIAFMITALYWILLYDAAEIENQTASRMFWLDVATHGINSCVVFVEVVTSRTPVAVLHFYQPLGLGLWYAAFSAIYFVAGGTDANGNPFIYEVLDWRQGKRAGAIVGIATSGLLVLYAALWTLAFCRDKLSVALLRTTGHELPVTPQDRHMSNGVV